MIALYHLIETPIDFWRRRGIKPQISETLLVKLTGTHNFSINFNNNFFFEKIISI